MLLFVIPEYSFRGDVEVFCTFKSVSIYLFYPRDPCVFVSRHIRCQICVKSEISNMEIIEHNNNSRNNLTFSNDRVSQCSLLLTLPSCSSHRDEGHISKFLAAYLMLMPAK